MSEEDQRPVPPVAILLQCTADDLRLLQNTLVSKLFGNQAPVAVNFTPDNLDFWWVSPLHGENLWAFIQLKPELSLNGAKEMLQTEQFVEFMQSHLLNNLSNHLDEAFDERWINAVRLVVFGTAEVANSTYARRVFEGLFPNASTVERVEYRDGRVEYLEPNEILTSLREIPIEELELGVRSYNCVKRAGIQTIADLVDKTEGELRAITYFGDKSVEEVGEKLAERGLSLRQD